MFVEKKVSKKEKIWVRFATFVFMPAVGNRTIEGICFGQVLKIGCHLMVHFSYQLEVLVIGMKAKT
jgi:hypothetical protein